MSADRDVRADRAEAISEPLRDELPALSREAEDRLNDALRGWMQNVPLAVSNHEATLLGLAALHVTALSAILDEIAQYGEERRVELDAEKDAGSGPRGHDAGPETGYYQRPYP